MTTAKAPTTSGSDQTSEYSVPTRPMSSDEWFVSEPELIETGDAETTSQNAKSFAPSAAEASTVAIRARNVLPPIRKDDFAIRRSDRKIKLLQQWECVILNVHHDSVECEMHDLTDDSQPVEFAEIHLNEFNHYDRPLLNEGTTFYWSVGRETSKTGTIRRYSDLRVRRLPPLSKLKKREIAAEAELLSELLKGQFKQ